MTLVVNQAGIIHITVFGKEFLKHVNHVEYSMNKQGYHFGVISSSMHIAWMRQVCGRLKSDYWYSNKLVYNNYPWPEAPSTKQSAAVEAAAQRVLDARKEFPRASLADLYDPLAMPAALVEAHDELDRAVDLCYRSQPFESDRQRVEPLCTLYEKLSALLIAPAKKGRRKAPKN